jgi:hypothetical protein
MSKKGQESSPALHRPAMIKKLHVVFKTHLDLGFTDLAAEVQRKYFEEYFPAAMQLAEELRTLGRERFIWTTGSWLVYEYLEKASPSDRKRMEQVIQRGYLAWHAMPFTTHSELMDASLFAFGLSLSQELDRRFGRQTIAAKMTDVPGHTRGIVPLLAGAGVRLLHIGVNPASAVPRVPPAFRWRSADGSEIMVIYQGEYGSIFTLPGCEQGLAFSHSNDNIGPQNLEQVQQTFAQLRVQFPGCEVFASTLDAFAQALLPFADSLPLVTAEIGDTWIQGIGSDPLLVSHFRRLSALRRARLARDPGLIDDARFKAFSRRLLTVPEHTWGMDIKTHLHDHEYFTPAQLAKARQLPNFQKVEASWAEKRHRIDEAILELGRSKLAVEAKALLDGLRPEPPHTQGWIRKRDRFLIKNKGVEAAFDGQTGSIVSLAWKASRPWADPAHPLGSLTYRTLSQADYDRGWKEYVRESPLILLWAREDFNKLGIEQAGAVNATHLPRLRDFYTKPDGCLLFLTFPVELSQAFGAPSLVTMEWHFDPGRMAAGLTLQWFDKPACRLPETLWLDFMPLWPTTPRLAISKLGEEIDASDVVSQGNRQVHAISSHATLQSATDRLDILSPDAPLLYAGRLTTLHFPDVLPDLDQGFHINLYNNLWATNFPQWFEDPMRYAITLLFKESSQSPVN